MNWYNQYQGGSYGGLPPAYNPPYGYSQQTTQAAQPTPPQSQNGLTWVQGESAAKSWAVAPGNTVLLMDSENPMFYLKTADAVGMPSMKVFRYEEVTAQPPSVPVSTGTDKYVTRAEYEELLRRLDALTAKEEQHE